jgi:hypothetical protein
MMSERSETSKAEVSSLRDDEARMHGDGAQCRRVAVAQGKPVRIVIYKAGSQPHFGGDRVDRSRGSAVVILGCSRSGSRLTILHGAPRDAKLPVACGDLLAGETDTAGRRLDQSQPLTGEQPDQHDRNE